MHIIIRSNYLIKKMSNYFGFCQCSKGCHILYAIINIGQRRSMINLCQWWKFLHNIVICIIYYGICWSHVHMVLDFGIMGFGSVICKTVQVPGTGIKSYFNTSLLIATDTNIIIHIQRNMVLWILCLNLDVSMHSSASLHLWVWSFELCPFHVSVLLHPWVSSIDLLYPSMAIC